MQDTTEEKRYQRITNSTRRCRECSEEALGRCPDCHYGFCQEHFPKQQHAPCAERQMRMAQLHACYVCSTPVYPDQWSLSKTWHVIDPATCTGCGRYVCDDLHTKRKVDNVVITREGLRGHRYQYISRYCDLCTPLYRVGGVRGVTRLVVSIGTVVGAIFFYLHH